MNEIKRYDQALADQLEHLPMPPEDIAWAEMEKLLEEDDDDPVVVPFFRRWGCLLPALVAASLLLIGGWLYFKRDAAPEPVSEQAPVTVSKTGSSSPGDTTTPATINNAPAGTVTRVSATVPADGNTNKSGQVNIDSSGDQATAESTGQSPRNRKKIAGRSAIKVTAGTSPGDENDPTGNGVAKRKRNNSSTGIKTKVRIAPTIAGEEEEDTATANTSKKNEQEDGGRTKILVQPGSAAAATTTTQTIVADSSNSIKKDSLPSKKTVISNPPAKKEEESKNNQWQLAAGLSVYQPLPLDGESMVPYNYYGRKGSLTDYIPEIYFRLYRTKKWFIHTGFRYGAPQSVKPFDYKQQIRDSAQSVFRTVYQLRKTYYHQVPLGFNYYVLPGLSLGAGVVYNHFSGALARQEVYRRAAIQDTLVSSSIIRDAEAGKFIKDHFQWSAEAQYQWKRLSIGARYSSDINPYIKYTDIITGAPVEKKMKALNVFIRYDLWRSKKWGK